jgi:hypothetical protein
MEDPLISGLGNLKIKENLLVLGLGLKDLTMVLGSISPTFTRTFNFKFRLGLVLAYFWGWFKCLFLSEAFFWDH